MFEDIMDGLVDSLKGQVGHQGDSKEDGGNPTSNVSDEGEDGSLYLVSDSTSGKVLYKFKKKPQFVGHCVTEITQKVFIFR